VLDKLKAYIQQLTDAGCVVDTLGVAQDVIDQEVERGEFVKCTQCSRVFIADRLTNGICVLCKAGEKPKSFKDFFPK
jgi:hypothetical protein